MKINENYHRTYKGHIKLNPRKTTNIQRYTHIIVFDAGIPYTAHVNGEKELKSKIEKFYLQHKGQDDFDFKVYNTNNEDVSDSQMVQELVADIIQKHE